MQDDFSIEDEIEEELLARQKVEQVTIEGENKDKETFVNKTEPDVKTSYKDRLVQVYDEIKSLNKDNLDQKIEGLKNEIAQIINDLEISNSNIRKLEINKIDKSMKEDNDLHYLPKTKSNIVKNANDNLFSTRNLLLLGVMGAVLLLVIVLLAVFAK